MRTLLFGLALVVGVAGLSGCTSSHRASYLVPSSPTPVPTSSTSSGTAPTTSTKASRSALPNATGPAMTKADFVLAVNALCTAQQSELAAARTPLSDLPSIAKFASSTSQILDSSLRQFSTLVAAQPDHVVLQNKWLSPRGQDYAAAEQALAVLKHDADSGNTSASQSQLAAIGTLPTHEGTVAPFLRSYGLTACA